ncbi:MAG: Glyoxalase/bleomycin resistance protein/dioxygenase [Acidimicrobiaceae bacterium]|nr:Glyoxalase/bleomycin resistance protein/dioxygenase [Acidimicrobiaceae bacterium]
MILGVGHFSFSVSNAGAAASWYTAALGFEQIYSQRQENAYTRRLLGVPDAVIDVALMRIPGPENGHWPLLELISYVSPPLTGGTVRPGMTSFAHLSLLVDDLEHEFRRLSALNVSFTSPPVAITAGVNHGGLICYLNDPDGNTLELFQAPKVASTV